MIFGSIYPPLLKSFRKNGRSQAELNQVIEWLTGFDEDKLQSFINENITFGEFFKQANINANAHLIKGVMWLPY